jgi:UPF0716 family protein affecting phage T7 exclusion
VIKRVIYGLMWFAVFFIISYAIGGYIYMKTTGVVIGGGFQAGLEAGRAARNAYRHGYLIYIMLGSLILAIIGTASSVLPGTKKKIAKKKKKNTKKKARRKSG